MTPLKLAYKAATGQFEQAMREMYSPMAAAATAAVREAGSMAQREGRADILAAGLGQRFANALRVNFYPPTGTSVNAAAWVYSKVKYAGVFERGDTISGKPLLWLPLGNLPPRIGGRRMTPRVYRDMVGPLHSINVSGHVPMLAAYVQSGSTTARGRRIPITRLRRGAALARLGVTQRRGAYGSPGVVSVPLFVGIAAVRLRKLTHLTDVFLRAQQALPGIYARNLARVA